MAMVKVPNLDKSEGQKPSSLAYESGDYGFEITGVTLTPKKSEKGSGTSWRFQLTILEGPDQADGKAPDGRAANRFVYIMNPDHESYEEWGHLGVDELESIRMAAGVDKKGSSIDPQAFVGEKLRCTLKKTLVKSGPREGQPENEWRNWRAWK